ncbi:MAG: [acyl-carrier-protein] S-malonyltransferase [Prochlorococcus sp. SP3034]|nr:[acyl-carrier-protein] S-malonyltransferase [Prochlorococcus sp. SP3034]|tara:strand:- start:15362 stop:16261 length:900 start_codon:yes stop_codon:yes gene_type:complete
MKISWVFPGQGSQKIGMGQSVIKLDNAKNRFNFASDIFDRDLYRICEKEADGDDNQFDLNNTQNTQICLFLVESILLDSLKLKGFSPDYIAGHSLGEITGLYAADVLSFEQCVSLIKVRSELMSTACEGSMAAIIGFNRDELDLQINKFDDVVVANDNSSSQVVLSGSMEGLDKISTQIKFKRFIKLNVSGAFHSDFMKDPALKFADYLDKIDFKEPSIPIISNSNPSFSNSSMELKIRLKNQMSNGVRWRETMDLMNSGDDELHIVEIGPSNVLGGLAKRHLRGVTVTQVTSSENLQY